MKEVSKGKRAVAIIIVIVCLVAVVRIFSSNGSKDTGSSKKIYYALGDAVATGRGLDNTNTSDVCGRTRLAYPSILATALDLTVENVSCSGAKLKDGLIDSESQNSSKIKSQLEQVFEKSKPDLLSITAGVNNFSLLSDFTNCRKNVCDLSNYKSTVNDVSNEMKTVLDKIKAHYNDKRPLTVVTGYYQILPANNNGCLELKGFDETEIAAWRIRTFALNEAIKKVVKDYSFARYADVNFADHELCTVSPWVQTFTEPAPLLPTFVGSEMIAKSVGTVVVNYVRSPHN